MVVRGDSFLGIIVRPGLFFLICEQAVSALKINLNAETAELPEKVPRFNPWTSVMNTSELYSSAHTAGFFRFKLPILRSNNYDFITGLAGSWIFGGLHR